MVCPGSLIKKDGDNKAFIALKDRWGCNLLYHESRRTQYRFILVRDIGGMGSIHTGGNGDISLKWVIENMTARFPK